jgi:hypothetical protein
MSGIPLLIQQQGSEAPGENRPATSAWYRLQCAICAERHQEEVRKIASHRLPAQARPDQAIWRACASVPRWYGSSQKPPARASTDAAGAAFNASRAYAANSRLGVRHCFMSAVHVEIVMMGSRCKATTYKFASFNLHRVAWIRCSRCHATGKTGEFKFRSDACAPA